MKIYAIGDLHLSFKEKFSTEDWDTVKEYKPMNCFGEKWDKHYQKIYKTWQDKVNEEDVILIPGDISWAKELKKAKKDLNFLAQLPGKKVLIKGNHDYWWQSISRLRSELPPKTYALQYDSIKFNNTSIAGTRGWVCPNKEEFSEHDQKIYRREKMRLEMSINSIKDRGEKLIVMFHYMPVNKNHEKNELIKKLIDYDVDICIYGHLHGEESHKIRLPEKKWGISFCLVSADFIYFNPLLIDEN